MGGGEWGRLRSLPRNMLWLCHISEIDIKYAECRCAGGGIPVAARRAIPRAHPDYGDAGIYREGHRASSKAKPRRDATFVPRSSERLICRCRGRIGPESDGAAPTSTRSHKTSGHPGWPRRGWSRYAFCSEGSLHESALSVRHLGRSMNGLRAGMSAPPLMAAARVAAGVTSLT